jgi:hypothetical protein
LARYIELANTLLRLVKYDDEPEKQTLSLSTDGTLSLNENETDEIRRKMFEAGKSAYNLEVTKTAAPEYFTEKEMEVKFKKPKEKKKKKLIRKKEGTELVPLPDSETSIGKSVDHGSRSDSAKLKSAEQKAEASREKKERGYEIAAAKAAEQSKLLVMEHPPALENEDEEMLKALANSRSFF